MRKARAVLAVVACAAATQAVALGAGPSPGVLQGGNGIARGDVRYVTVRSLEGTTLAAIRRGGGTVLRSKALLGSWGIPLVAYDATPGGLSADGGALILAEADGIYPGKQRTSFLVVETRRLRTLQTLSLKGSFSFDALSPNGRYLYLIEHLWDNESTPRYRVRAYDLRQERLLARVIADKTSWETDMEGYPVSRVAREAWSYTFYGAVGPRPFIHALDLRHATAVCIDMPWKYQPKQVFSYRLRWDRDGHMVVRGPHGRALAVVDPASKRVLRFVRDP